MALTIFSETDIANQALAYLRNRFPTRDSSTESFLGKLARTFAMTAASFQQAAYNADANAVPSTRSSSAALDAWAYVFGVPSGVAGQYGRKVATAASGGTITITGTKGTAYTAGLVLVAPDGVTQLSLVANVTISGSPPGSGSVSGTVNAVTTGTVGNLPSGTVLTWQSPPGGSDATATLSVGLSNGLDTESGSALLGRILQRLQNPPRGGTSSDYRYWAESVSGISRAYVYPQRGGLGTVHVVLTQAGSGTGRRPSSTSAVDTYIATVRPVTNQGYTSYLPFNAVSGLTVRVRISPNSLYPFDWDDTGGSYTVSAYSPGSPATLTLSSVPASLSSAAAAGKLPRLQVLSTGTGAPVTQQVRVVSIVGSVCTLENPLPSGFVAPNNGDTVYAGGPAVAPIASAELAYVDSLGPSRASGTADANDVWEDTCAIARLIQTALDQVDSSSNRYATNVTAATINGSAADVQAADTSTNPPELLYARWVAVTQ